MRHQNGISAVFFWRHFAEKPVATSRNVCRFLSYIKAGVKENVRLTYMQVCPHSELRMPETFNYSFTRLQWAFNKDSLRLSQNLAAILIATVWSEGGRGVGVHSENKNWFLIRFDPHRLISKRELWNTRNEQIYPQLTNHCNSEKQGERRRFGKT